MVDTFSPLPQTECDIIRSGIVVNHQMTCLYCAPQTKIIYCFTKLNSAIEWMLSWVNHSSCPTSPSSVVSLRRVAFGFSIAALQAFVAQCSGAWNKSDEHLVWLKTRVISFLLPTQRAHQSSFIHVEADLLHLAIEIPLYLPWWMVKELEFNQPKSWRPVPHIPWSTKDIDLNLKSDC